MYQVFASELEAVAGAGAAVAADVDADEAAGDNFSADTAGAATPSGFVEVAGDVQASSAASAARVKRDVPRARRIRRLKAQRYPVHEPDKHDASG
jgi:hypothetical protein